MKEMSTPMEQIYEHSLSEYLQRDLDAYKEGLKMVLLCWTACGVSYMAASISHRSMTALLRRITRTICEVNISFPSAGLDRFLNLRYNDRASSKYNNWITYIKPFGDFAEIVFETKADPHSFRARRVILASRVVWVGFLRFQIGKLMVVKKAAVKTRVSSPIQVDRGYAYNLWADNPKTTAMNGGADIL